MTCRSTVPEAIGAGDDLSLTIEDVLQPCSASGTCQHHAVWQCDRPLARRPCSRANVSYPMAAWSPLPVPNTCLPGAGFRDTDPATLSALAKVDDA